jgi:hypothetical protein
MHDRSFALFVRAKKAKDNGLASVSEGVFELRETDMPKGAGDVK